MDTATKIRIFPAKSMNGRDKRDIPPLLPLPLIFAVSI